MWVATWPCICGNRDSTKFTFGNCNAEGPPLSTPEANMSIAVECLRHEACVKSKLGPGLSVVGHPWSTAGAFVQSCLQSSEAITRSETEDLIRLVSSCQAALVRAASVEKRHLVQQATLHYKLLRHLQSQEYWHALLEESLGLNRFLCTITSRRLLRQEGVSELAQQDEEQRQQFSFLRKHALSAACQAMQKEAPAEETVLRICSALQLAIEDGVVPAELALQLVASRVRARVVCSVAEVCACIEVLGAALLTAKVEAALQLLPSLCTIMDCNALWHAACGKLSPEASGSLGRSLAEKAALEIFRAHRVPKDRATPTEFPTGPLAAVFRNAWLLCTGTEAPPVRGRPWSTDLMCLSECAGAGQMGGAGIEVLCILFSNLAAAVHHAPADTSGLPAQGKKGQFQAQQVDMGIDLCLAVSDMKHGEAMLKSFHCSARVCASLGVFFAASCVCHKDTDLVLAERAQALLHHELAHVRRQAPMVIAMADAADQTVLAASLRRASAATFNASLDLQADDKLPAVSLLSASLHSLLAYMAVTSETVDAEPSICKDLHKRVSLLLKSLPRESSRERGTVIELFVMGLSDQLRRHCSQQTNEHHMTAMLSAAIQGLQTCTRHLENLCQQIQALLACLSSDNNDDDDAKNGVSEGIAEVLSPARSNSSVDKISPEPASGGALFESPLLQPLSRENSRNSGPGAPQGEVEQAMTLQVEFTRITWSLCSLTKTVVGFAQPHGHKCMQQALLATTTQLEACFGLSLLTCNAEAMAAVRTELFSTRSLLADALSQGTGEAHAMAIHILILKSLPLIPFHSEVAMPPLCWDLINSHENTANAFSRDIHLSAAATALQSVSGWHASDKVPDVAAIRADALRLQAASQPIHEQASTSAERLLAACMALISSASMLHASEVSITAEGTDQSHRDYSIDSRLHAYAASQEAIVFCESALQPPSKDSCSLPNGLPYASESALGTERWLILHVLAQAAEHCTLTLSILGQGHRLGKIRSRVSRILTRIGLRFSATLISSAMISVMPAPRPALIPGLLAVARSAAIILPETALLFLCIAAMLIRAGPFLLALDSDRAQCQGEAVLAAMETGLMRAADTAKPGVGDPVCAPWEVVASENEGVPCWSDLRALDGMECLQRLCANSISAMRARSLASATPPASISTMLYQYTQRGLKRLGLHLLEANARTCTVEAFTEHAASHDLFKFLGVLPLPAALRGKGVSAGVLGRGMRCRRPAGLRVLADEGVSLTAWARKLVQACISGNLGTSVAAHYLLCLARCSAREGPSSMGLSASQTSETLSCSPDATLLRKASSSREVQAASLLLAWAIHAAGSNVPLRAHAACLLASLAARCGAPAMAMLALVEGLGTANVVHEHLVELELRAYSRTGSVLTNTELELTLKEPPRPSGASLPDGLLECHGFSALESCCACAISQASQPATLAIAHLPEFADAPSGLVIASTGPSQAESLRPAAVRAAYVALQDPGLACTATAPSAPGSPCMSACRSGVGGDQLAHVIQQLQELTSESSEGCRQWTAALADVSNGRGATATLPNHAASPVPTRGPQVHPVFRLQDAQKEQRLQTGSQEQREAYKQRWWEWRTELDTKLGVLVQDMSILCQGALEHCLATSVSNKGANSAALVPSQPLMLLLSPGLHGFPWEALPSLSDLPIFRALHLPAGWLCQAPTAMPSSRSGAVTPSTCTAEGRAAAHEVDVGRAVYIVDPSGDLPCTRQRFGPWFAGLQGWQGSCGPPGLTAAALRDALDAHELFVYLGHGAGSATMPHRELGCRMPMAVLMGCSSARLKGAELGGSLEGALPGLLAAGSPCVIGNLWDVTDRDIDRFTEGMLNRLVPAKADPLEVTSKMKKSSTRRDGLRTPTGELSASGIADKLNTQLQLTAGPKAHVPGLLAVGEHEAALPATPRISRRGRMLQMRTGATPAPTPFGAPGPPHQPQLPDHLIADSASDTPANVSAGGGERADLARRGALLMAPPQLGGHLERGRSALCAHVSTSQGTCVHAAASEKQQAPSNGLQKRETDVPVSEPGAADTSVQPSHGRHAVAGGAENQSTSSNSTRAACQLVSELVNISRASCKLRYLNGAAPVCYGVPTCFALRSTAASPLPGCSQDMDAARARCGR